MLLRQTSSWTHTQVISQTIVIIGTQITLKEYSVTVAKLIQVIIPWRFNPGVAVDSSPDTSTFREKLGSACSRKHTIKESQTN